MSSISIQTFFKRYEQVDGKLRSKVAQLVKQFQDEFDPKSLLHEFLLLSQYNLHYEEFMKGFSPDQQQELWSDKRAALTLYTLMVCLDNPGKQ